MEMEGSIQEFSVPEILQFLSLHEADGVLKLKSGKEEVHFGFKHGKLTDALHKGEQLFHSISEYVQRTGLIPPETIKKYMDRAKEAGISLLELIEKGEILSKKEIERIIAFKIQETTCEALTWNSGRYSFEAGKKLYQHSAFSVEIEPNNLVMEGMRRIDEWPLIEQALPDGDVTLRRKEEAEIEVDLGQDEQTILDKIEKDIALDELVGVSGIGKFRTYNSVYKLTEIGLIEKIKVKGKKKKPVKKTFVKKQKMPFAVDLKNALLYGFIIIHVFFLFKFRVSHIGDNFRNIKNLFQDRSRIETILPLSTENE
jgi:hypothetical protein